MQGRILGPCALVFASVGLFISAVLVLAHVNHVPVPCGGSGGCDEVLTSQYSQVFGVPLAFVGLGTYAVLLVLAMLAPVSPKARAIGFGLSFIGAMASVWLTIVSVTQLHATCRWCLGSAATMGALLVVWALILKKAPLRVNYVLTALFVVAALAGAFWVSRLAESQVKSTVAKQTLVDMDILSSLPRSELMTEDSAWKGSKDGKIVLVEFADFACPACRDVYGRLKKLLADVDGIRLIYRHLPQSHLEGHEASLEGAICGELANRAGKFWEFCNLSLAIEHPKASDYKRILTQLGVSSVEGREAAAKTVDRDRALSRKLGMKLTPVFIVLSPELPPTVTTNVDLTDVLRNPTILKYVEQR
jgi:uncharacterized membrane protein